MALLGATVGAAYSGSWEQYWLFTVKNARRTPGASLRGRWVAGGSERHRRQAGSGLAHQVIEAEPFLPGPAPGTISGSIGCPEMGDPGDSQGKDPIHLRGHMVTARSADPGTMRAVQTGLVAQLHNCTRSAKRPLTCEAPTDGAPRYLRETRVWGDALFGVYSDDRASGVRATP